MEFTIGDHVVASIDQVAQPDWVPIPVPKGTRGWVTQMPEGSEFTVKSIRVRCVVDGSPLEDSFDADGWSLD